MNYTFVSATILLILITDPIGTIPIFANALQHVAPQRRARAMRLQRIHWFACCRYFFDHLCWPSHRS